MVRFALTLVVGLMLSVSGSAWGDKGYSRIDGNQAREWSNERLCEVGELYDEWANPDTYYNAVYPYYAEAKRRGLSCGVGESGSTQVTTTSTNTSSLPACPSNQDAYWHNCFGTYTFVPKSEWAGDQYVGEHKDGKRNG